MSILCRASRQLAAALSGLLLAVGIQAGELATAIRAATWVPPGDSCLPPAKTNRLYLSERVKSLTEGAQSTVTIVPNGEPDFPLVLGPRQGTLK